MLTVAARAEEPKLDPAGVDLFESEIRPLLVQHCYECHSADAAPLQAGLRLDTRGGTLAGGDSGPAVVPGKPHESLLLSALKFEDYEMPPSGKLPAHQVAAVERWIQMGAPDPRSKEPAPPAEPKEIDLAAASAFWAFQPPVAAAPPSIPGDTWSRRPLDRFVLAKLHDASLEPSPPAGPRTLARRLSFDLTGLPPEPAVVEAFAADPSDAAYGQLVDRLLDSPRFGEHWARMWLDLARYAEDQAHIVGDNRSLTYPNAYLYRDWVIDAFAADLPYDEFLRKQLAIDLIESMGSDELVALGFLGLGPKYYRRGSLEVMADEWEDRIDVVTRGLQGLTVSCARCHDHKYDPIRTEDYYSLAGIFASTDMFNRALSPEVDTGKDGQAKEPGNAMHIVFDGKPRDLNVFIRGNVESKGEVVPRGFLGILDGASAFDGTPDGSGRKELAESIANDKNPLTARVYVNRIWARVVGKPIVGTPSNFGQLGERPTHPELLDHLAVQFMESGWSTKRLIREIVTSATYRQSSVAPTASASTANRVDPGNTLLWKMNRKRLPVEAWRDAILSAAGRLEATIGGKSMGPADPEVTRRTVYAEVSRLELDKMLALFDFPDPNAHSAKRAETMTPLQNLFVLNSPFLKRQAEAVAQRVSVAAPGEPAAQVDHLYRLLFSRPPQAAERELGVAYVTAAEPSGTEGRLVQYAHALLATNELAFLD